MIPPGTFPQSGVLESKTQNIINKLSVLGSNLRESNSTWELITNQTERIADRIKDLRFQSNGYGTMISGLNDCNYALVNASHDMEVVTNDDHLLKKIDLPKDQLFEAFTIDLSYGRSLTVAPYGPLLVKNKPADDLDFLPKGKMGLAVPIKITSPSQDSQDSQEYEIEARTYYRVQESNPNQDIFSVKRSMEFVIFPEQLLPKGLKLQILEQIQLKFIKYDEFYLPNPPSFSQFLPYQNAYWSVYDGYLRIFISTGRKGIHQKTPYPKITPPFNTAIKIDTYVIENIIKKKVKNYDKDAFIKGLSISSTEFKFKVGIKKQKKVKIGCAKIIITGYAYVPIHCSLSTSNNQLLNIIAMKNGKIEYDLDGDWDLLKYILQLFSAVTDRWIQLEFNKEIPLPNNTGSSVSVKGDDLLLNLKLL